MRAPTYRESSEESAIVSLPMAHLSIEIGHFSLEEILDGTDRIRKDFQRAVPLVRAFTEATRLEFGPDAEVSTCYLLDDYFQPGFEPAKVLDKLLAAADRAGLAIDYLARESGCHQTSVFTGGIPVGDP